MREVPAILRFTNALGTGAAGAYGNWERLVGGTEDYGTWTPATLPPAQGDSLRFDGSVTSASCTGVYGFGLDDTTADYAAIKFVNNYGGTVSFASEVTPGGEGGGGSPTNQGIAVTTFTMGSGALNQQVAASELFVLSSFTWTGGTINSGTGYTIASKLTVAGSGTITVPSGGLAIGDTINFTNPTAAAVQTVISGAGTLSLTAGEGINLQANAKVKEIHSNDAALNIDTVSGIKTLTLVANSWWGFIGSGTGTFGLRVWNKGGKFFLGDPELGRAQVTITMTAGNAFNPAYVQNWGLNNTSELQIMNGCVLDVSGNQGVVIGDGSVWLVGNTDLGVNQQIATIKGTYAMTGGAIQFLTPTVIGGGNVYGFFKVDGDVKWSAGQFNPGLACEPNAPTNPRVGNRWQFSGTMTVDTSGASKPTIHPVPLGGQPQAGAAWDVIEALGSGRIVLKEGSVAEPEVTAGWLLRPKIENGVKKGYGVEKKP